MMLIGKTVEKTRISHLREGLFQNGGKEHSTTILALSNLTLTTILCADAITTASIYVRGTD